MKNLYVGAAGVLWALDRLRERAHAETRLDLAAAAETTLDAWRREPTSCAARSSPPESSRRSSREWPGSCSSHGARARRERAAPRDGDRRGRAHDLAGNAVRRASRRRAAAAVVLGSARRGCRRERLHRPGAAPGRRPPHMAGGPHGLEKGHGICHGTAGNGYALLAASRRTGDEEWLARARRFAVHALAQAETGSGRFSLWTGDPGPALLASDASRGTGATRSSPERRRPGGVDSRA
jgi:hypothetical protein